MKTILIIDVSRRHRLIVESMLERNGFMPMSAADVRQGLELARTLQPDFVLIDIVDAHGRETLDRTLSDPRTREIPIIAMGPNLSLGCHAPMHSVQNYLVKPVTEPALMHALARLPRDRATPLAAMSGR